MPPSDDTPTASRPAPAPPRALPPGVYAPTPAFFHDDGAETLDLPTLARHAVRLARAGVAGLAVQGSTGEAVHLTDAERGAVIATTRAALDGAGFAHLPLLVGAGAQSTRQTVARCRQAAACGGDAVLVLPPGYYQGLFAGEDTVLAFFREVAEQSPLPVLVYNFPGAVAGLDLSSDVLVRLGRENANIVGAKFTCGNTGKLGRVASAFNDSPKSAKQGTNGSHHHVSTPAPEFLCFAGSGDFLVPALSVGAAGVIGGIANVAPKAVVRLYQAFRDGRRDEVDRLQEIVARGDWAAIQSGIVGVKVCLQKYEGYGGWARMPLPRPEGERREEIVNGFRELMQLERSL